MPVTASRLVVLVAQVQERAGQPKPDGGKGSQRPKGDGKGGASQQPWGQAAKSHGKGGKGYPEKHWERNQWKRQSYWSWHDGEEQPAKKSRADERKPSTPKR